MHNCHYCHVYHTFSRGSLFDRFAHLTSEVDKSSGHRIDFRAYLLNQSLRSLTAPTCLLVTIQ